MRGYLIVPLQPRQESDLHGDEPPLERKWSVSIWARAGERQSAWLVPERTRRPSVLDYGTNGQLLS